MNNQLFIPEKIKVGYQQRQGTYTGQLAYVIYFDQKGVLRKEKSWEGWRDKKIEPQEFPNDPIEGFVFNKDAGGKRHSYGSGWDMRMEKVRVYDPRDFEMEICIPNLLTILRDCNCNKGKGIEGKCVYAWLGTELVLLPVASEEYKNSLKYTSLQSQGVLSKDLILGAGYITKKEVPLIYIGRFTYHDIKHEYERYSYHNETINPNTAMLKESKQYVFLDTKSDSLTYMKDLKSLATLVSDTVVPNYAELVDRYLATQFASKIVAVEMVLPVNDREKNNYYSRYFYSDLGDGVFEEYAEERKDGGYMSGRDINKPEELVMRYTGNTVKFQDGQLGHYPDPKPQRDSYYNSWRSNEPKRKTIEYSLVGYLVATQENGKKYLLQDGRNLTTMAEPTEDETEKFDLD